MKPPLTIALMLVGLLASTSSAQPPCEPWPPPGGPTIEVVPAQAGELSGIVAAAPGGTTVLLHDGIYDLSHGDAVDRLSFNTPGVTLRSFSGDRSAVVLDGNYGTDEIVSIHASDVVIADLTVTRAYNHPIHVSGHAGAPITGVTLHNLAVVDPGQQAVKINPVEDGYADFGLIECSFIVLTDVGREQIRDDCYTGGVDAHKAWGWVVRRNRIQGFWCDEGLSEHGIHFWNTSRDTVAEENVIVDCVRSIGFGMREKGPTRVYPDDPYPDVEGYIGHIDGMIRNNFLAAADSRLFASESGFDSGISLEQAHGTEVHHNSVASTAAPLSSSIEWRWSNTLATLANNLATSVLKQRDGGVALLMTNIENAPAKWFESIADGDLHLTEAAESAVDAGTALPPGTADTDIDLQQRDGEPDIGADERIEGLFADGFESGDTSAWSQTVP